MGALTDLYRPSLALLTDLYQLTMAYAAWRSGVTDREAVFHLFFRQTPFDGGFAVACGLEHAVDWLTHARFDEADCGYLATLRSADGTPLFDADFLVMLRELRFDVDVDAVPEGSAVFAHEPLLRLRGPIIPCMLAETPLLNLVNFQTLVATKAARIAIAAAGDPVLEFGLRRAQGVDGALAASRAAYVGGCAATSNVLAGRLFGIPVRGTHAHSWVMLFDDERTAFDTYAAALPRNCVFLVDTYDTLAGVRNAIAVGQQLRLSGHPLLGVRLDSGDLADLSIRARALLDAAGFADTRIYATNDLDEKIIQSLKQQGATIAVWGVGTRLVTAFDDPALGGVYKLAAVRTRGDSAWQYRVKLSEQAIKTSIPGLLQVRRLRDGQGLLGDAIYDVEQGWPTGGDAVVIDPFDPTKRRIVAAATASEDLLQPVLRRGAPVAALPALAAIRDRTLVQVAALPAGVKRFINAHRYPVWLEQSLHETRARLIAQARAQI